MSHISDSVDPEANIIFGVAFDETLDDELKITVIATGFVEKATDRFYDEKIRKTNVADVKYGSRGETADFKDVVDAADDGISKILEIFNNRG